MSNALARHTYTENGSNYLYPFVRTDCIFYPDESKDNGIDESLRGGNAVAKSMEGSDLLYLNSLGVSSEGSTFGVNTTDDPTGVNDSSVVLSASVGRIELMAQGCVGISGGDVTLGASKLILCDEEKGVYIQNNTTTQDYTTVVRSKMMITSPSTTVTGGSSVTFTGNSTLRFSAPSTLNMEGGSTLTANVGSTATFNNQPTFNNGISIASGNLSLGNSSGIRSNVSGRSNTLFTVIYTPDGAPVPETKATVSWTGSKLTSSLTGDISLRSGKFEVIGTNRKVSIVSDRLSINNTTPNYTNDLISLGVGTNDNALINLRHSGYYADALVFTTSNTTTLKMYHSTTANNYINLNLKYDANTVELKSVKSLRVVAEGDVSSSLILKATTLDLTNIDTIKHKIESFTATGSTITYGQFGELSDRPTRIYVRATSANQTLSFPLDSLREGHVVYVHGRTGQGKNVTINYADADNQNRSIEFGGDNKPEFTAVFIGLKTGLATAGNQQKVGTYLVSSVQYN